MARVLVLRAEAEAAETSAALAARGHQPLQLPLQEILILDPPLPDGGFAGLLVTSANAVPWARACSGLKGMPVLAVGERTGLALRIAGFTDVAVGEGNGAALAGMALPLVEEAGLPMLYAAGRVRTAGLEDRLSELKIPFTTIEAYDTKPLNPGPREVATVLEGRAPDVVLLLSIGQAKGYAAMVKSYPEGFWPPPRLLCLSDRIAAALPGELRLTAEISARPGLAALFDLDL